MMRFQTNFMLILKILATLRIRKRFDIKGPTLVVLEKLIENYCLERSFNIISIAEWAWYSS